MGIGEVKFDFIGYVVARQVPDGVLDGGADTDEFQARAEAPRPRGVLLRVR